MHSALGAYSKYAPGELFECTLLQEHFCYMLPEHIWILFQLTYDLEEYGPWA